MLNMTPDDVRTWETDDGGWITVWPDQTALLWTMEDEDVSHPRHGTWNEATRTFREEDTGEVFDERGRPVG